MATFTRNCEWCGQTFTKTGKPSAPPRFCNRTCSAKWRMSNPEFVASLDTPKRRAAASENMRRWRESPEGHATLQAHLKGSGNPLRDPAVRAKAQATLREQSYQVLNGGNGQLTVPQKLLAARLGWATEVPIVTERKSPYPHAYKVDLASPELMIAIEVDGESHKNPRAREIDERQDDLLRDLGWTVLRFWNRQVLEETETVMAQIMAAVASSTSKRGPATT